jgi:hypothetical protein
MKARFLALLALAAGPAPGCLLFTNSINEQPSVMIIGPKTRHRGEKGTYTASAHDDGERGLTYAWGSSDTCPASLGEARKRDPAAGFAAEYELPTPTDKANVCVFVVVTDDEGAANFAAYPVQVVAHQLKLTGPDHGYRGEELVFTAEYVGEPEITRTAKYRWAWAPKCDVASLNARIAQVKQEAPANGYKIATALDDAFCVAVVAEDSFHAQDSTTTMVTSIINRAPSAVISVLSQPAKDGTFGIFSSVRLSGAMSMDPDGDVLTYTWKPELPADARYQPCDDASAASAAAQGCPCSEGKKPGSEVCITTGAAEAVYSVALQVSDGPTTSPLSPPVKLSVKDAPPCIRLTDPDLGTRKVFLPFGDHADFSVLRVEDDGDPLPPLPAEDQPRRSLVWSVRWGTAKDFVVYSAGAASSSYRLSHAFQPGQDTAQVRVSYSDRVGYTTATGRKLDCPVDAPTCELVPDSGCYAWVTWTVLF